MAKLAIKGHATRGKEVIEILEMMGGQTDWCTGTLSHCAYFINKANRINYTVITDEAFFTLEEFLEKFPYKVGDKVIDIKTNRIVEIYKAHWSESNNCTYYDVKLCNNTGYVRSYKFLQPYKEETMTEASKAIFDVNAQCCDIMNHLIKEETMEEQITIEDITLEKAFMCTFLEMVEGKQRLRIALNEGFELKEENGNFFVCRKKVEYPKTYEECCEVLLLKPERATYSVSGLEYKRHLIVNLQRLLICRNAYWKIYGEELGLDKPWEPKWDDENEFKYGLYHFRNGIMRDGSCINSTLLAFPTEEMRDTFYENFKDLIEKCKELL